MQASPQWCAVPEARRRSQPPRYPGPHAEPAPEAPQTVNPGSASSRRLIRGRVPQTLIQGPGR
eukprot:8781808-Alexandrium_andersonii.AAC.1